MNSPVHLAVDLMGGDTGAKVVYPAALKALDRDPHLELTLVGLERDYRELSAGRPASPRLNFEPVTEVVAMNDRIGLALRTGTRSSMGRALELVSCGNCAGAVSAGNTAALVALGIQLLHCLDGLDRPLLGTALPAGQGRTWLLDVGADLDDSADKLAQTARLGALLSRLLDGVEQPRVGLLNVGAEETKGRSSLREAAALLEGSPNFAFAGFAEGSDLFRGRFDVIVTDGFTGNIALKTVEATARFLLDGVRRSLMSGIRSRLGMWLLAPSLLRFRRQTNPSAFNGAPLLGLGGLAVKSHGAASINGFAHAIGLTAELARLQLTERIALELAQQDG